MLAMEQEPLGGLEHYRSDPIHIEPVVYAD